MILCFVSFFSLGIRLSIPDPDMGHMDSSDSDSDHDQPLTKSKSDDIDWKLIDQLIDRYKSKYTDAGDLAERVEEEYNKDKFHHATPIDDDDVEKRIYERLRRNNQAHQNIVVENSPHPESVPELSDVGFHVNVAPAIVIVGGILVLFIVGLCILGVYLFVRRSRKRKVGS